MTEIDTDKLRALDEAATPAPWITQGLPYDGFKDPVILGGPDRIYVAQTVYDMQGATEIHEIDEDTEIIAYLRNSVPAILAMAEENKRLRQALERIERIASGYEPDGSDYDEGYFEGQRNMANIARRALGRDKA